MKNNKYKEDSIIKYFLQVYGTPILIVFITGLVLWQLGIFDDTYGNKKPYSVLSITDLYSYYYDCVCINGTNESITIVTYINICDEYVPGIRYTRNEFSKCYMCYNYTIFDCSGSPTNDDCVPCLHEEKYTEEIVVNCTLWNCTHIYR